MRRKSLMAVAVALVLGLFVSVWGAGPTSAQTHDDHDHPTTTTTAPGPTTTLPGTTTTTTRPTTPPTTVPPPTPGTQRKAVRYGPYTVPAAAPNPDGSHGHAHTGNQFAFNVEKPCTNCYITAMRPDLVDASGRQVGFSTGQQLHHMVLANQSWGRVDSTCYFGFPFPLGFLFGQRFFAAGDERTPFVLPAGYGYRVGPWDAWNLIWDLAGMGTTPKDVYFQVTFDFVPITTAGMTDAEPVWLDVDQCGDSQVDIPVGPSQQTYTWTVNRPGKLLGLGGHLHDSGIDIAVTDQTGRNLCTSVARYGETPLYIDPMHGAAHLSSMSTCYGTRSSPITTLRNGDQVTIRSRYNSPKATNDAMGIVVGYIAAS